MSRRMKLGLLAGLVIAVVGGIAALAAAKKGGKPAEVRLEPVGRRDLVAVVTASGTIEAKTKVDLSADVTGRILKLTVKEGDVVQKGQLLVVIDPAQFQGAVSRSEALLSANQAALVQARTNRDQAKRNFDRANELRTANPNLISAEAVEQSKQAYDVAVATYSSAEAQVEQARAALKEANDNLARTRLYAPISGRVTRLAVEEGEVAVPGTFSRETGLLMTIADLSVIQAKVQVDETDVVRVHLGDSVSVTIDAFTDTTFVGKVTKIGNSAIRAAAAAGTADRAVDFDVEITLINPPADIRPDLSATARIVTATRTRALSIPIIALTVRDETPVATEGKGDAKAVKVEAPAPAKGDTGAGGKKKEIEGVFIEQAGTVTFRPVKVGIAGDEYFEVVDGVKEGETIVAGPYQAIRDLKDGAKVKQAAEPKDKKDQEKKS